MNLIQQQNYLEYADKNDLVKMMQEPNPQFPSFLVLSEIQRRTINEKNFQAMQQRPTSTVAQEVVSNFVQPTGLQGGAPQATPLPTNISAGLSGAPTAPMQMAASGGITGFANTGSTSLPAGYTILQLADKLGVDIANPDGSLKTQDQIKNEVTIAYQGATTPAVASPSTVTDTSVLPAGTAPAPAPAPVVTPAPAPAPAPSGLQISQALIDEAKALGINPSLANSISDLQLKINAAKSITDAPAIKPETNRIEQIVDLSNRIDVGKPDESKFDISLVETPAAFTKPINRQKLTARNYNVPTEEDRQRELDVAALAGLAQAVGGAKNLAEFGSSVGDVALGLQKVKKGQRADLNVIEGLKRADQMQDIALSQSYDTQERDVAKLITEINLANNSAEANAGMKLEELKLQYGAKQYEIAQSIVHDQILQEQIKATQDKNLLDAYNTLQVDEAKMEFFDPNMDLNPDGSAKTETGRQWLNISRQKRSLLEQWYKSKGLTPPPLVGNVAK